MKEKLITIVLTILVIVVPMAILPTVAIYYNVPKIIALIFLAFILLILFLCNYKKITVDKKDILLIIFALLIFLSSIFSSDFKTSLLGNKTRYEGMLAFYSYIIIYLCTKKFFKYKNIKTLLIVLYSLFIPICLFGVSQYYIKIKGFAPYLVNGGVRATFENTNIIGTFLSLGMPIFSILFISKGYKLSFITSMLIFFCMAACGARSSWVAFAFYIIALIIYLIKQKNKKFFIRTIILLLSFVLIFTYQYTAKNSFVKRKVKAATNDIKVATTQGVTDKLGSSRIFIWKETIKVIIKHPILGVGTDNLAKGILENPTEETTNFINKYKQLIDKAHNEYLHIAVTIGVPALITYLTFLILVLYKRKNLIFKNTMFFMLYLSILCYLVQAFFNISAVGIAPLLWFALGLMDNQMISENAEKIT